MAGISPSAFIQPEPRSVPSEWAITPLSPSCASPSCASSAAALTELLRPETAAIPAEAPEALDSVREDYALTVGVIRAYIGEEG